jgi:hypothetical protein
MIRHARGRGQGRPPPLRARAAASAARAMGVSAVILLVSGTMTGGVAGAGYAG